MLVRGKILSVPNWSSLDQAVLERKRAVSLKICLWRVLGRGGAGVTGEWGAFQVT